MGEPKCFCTIIEPCANCRGRTYRHHEAPSSHSGVAEEGWAKLTPGEQWARRISDKLDIASEEISGNDNWAFLDGSMDIDTIEELIAIFLSDGEGDEDSPIAEIVVFYKEPKEESDA